MRREPEGIEDYYARIVAAADPEGRLPTAAAEATGRTGPYDPAGLRLSSLHPLADAEAPRRNDSPARCWCRRGFGPDDGLRVWSNERWSLSLRPDTGLPLRLSLGPLEHHDLPGLPSHLAAELGQLVVAVTEAVEQVPSVGRAQVARYGDGGGHLHVFLLGRPARMTQLQGAALVGWEQHLPRVPLEVLQANARVVAERLVVHVGGGAGLLGDVR